MQIQPGFLRALDKALRQTNGVRWQRVPFRTICRLVFNLIGQREQAAVKVVAVSIAFVELIGRKPSIQILSFLPKKGVKAATTDQRAGGAHAGFPFVPLPVAFAVAEGKRSFGVVYGAFEKIARQRRALYDTAQQALV